MKDSSSSFQRWWNEQARSLHSLDWPSCRGYTLSSSIFWGRPSWTGPVQAATPILCYSSSSISSANRSIAQPLRCPDLERHSWRMPQPSKFLSLNNCQKGFQGGWPCSKSSHWSCAPVTWCRSFLRDLNGWDQLELWILKGENSHLNWKPYLMLFETISETWNMAVALKVQTMWFGLEVRIFFSVSKQGPHLTAIKEDRDKQERRDCTTFPAKLTVSLCQTHF